jgi:hypothetical protein
MSRRGRSSFARPSPSREARNPFEGSDVCRVGGGRALLDRAHRGRRGTLPGFRSKKETGGFRFPENPLCDSSLTVSASSRRPEHLLIGSGFSVVALHSHQPPGEEGEPHRQRFLGHHDLKPKERSGWVKASRKSLAARRSARPRGGRRPRARRRRAHPACARQVDRASTTTATPQPPRRPSQPPSGPSTVLRLRRAIAGTCAAVARQARGSPRLPLPPALLKFRRWPRTAPT